MSQPTNSTVQAAPPSSNNTQFVTHIPQAQANSQTGSVRYVQSQQTASTGSNQSQPVQYAIAPTPGMIEQRRALPGTRMVHIVKHTK